MMSDDSERLFRKRARSSYPKLWEEEEDPARIGTNQPSKKMPSNIPPGTEHSFHWARSVPNTSLPSSGLKFTSTLNNEPFIVRFKTILSRSFVIGQEFALSTLFLVAHRCVVCRSSDDADDFFCLPCVDDECLLMSMHAFTSTLVVIGVSTMVARRQHQEWVGQRKRDRLHSRSIDAILIAGILRFLSSVLRTLTASYSSDTVTALAVGGMILHVISADYNYANGISEKAELKQMKGSYSYAEKLRPMFLGGTVSINCVFFSAALLASRLPSDTVSYLFFMWTVILFAYYPEARYLVAHTQFGVKGEAEINDIHTVRSLIGIQRLNFLSFVLQLLVST